MMSGVLTPMFLQAAGRSGKGEKDYIFLIASGVSNSIRSLTCNGKGKIYYTEDDEEKVMDFENSLANRQILADEGTEVVIEGKVSNISFNNTTWQDVNTASCHTLKSLEISGTLTGLALNSDLELLECQGAPNIKNISYDASDLTVSQVLAQRITAATSSTGNLYTDKNKPGYNTLRLAATGKGWTVHTQL